MDALLVLLGLVSLIAMAVGLFRPNLVILWGEKKTRSRVLMFYGGLIVVLFVALGMTGTANSEKSNNLPVSKIEESKNIKQQMPEVTVTPVVNKVPEVSYTNEKAKQRISDWFWEHQFPGDPRLSLTSGVADGNFYEVDGKKYYMFTLTGLPRAVDILVDPYSGELFFYDTGLKPQPLDKWYLEYKTSHKASSPANERINEKFEWVEKPSVQNGAIVGKVKNISKDEFVDAYIEFNAFDAGKNQLSGILAAQTRNLKPGAVWSFRIQLYMPNIASYEFQSVKGYTW